MGYYCSKLGQGFSYGAGNWDENEGIDSRDASIYLCGYKDWLFVKWREVGVCDD